MLSAYDNICFQANFQPVYVVISRMGFRSMLCSSANQNFLNAQQSDSRNTV